MSTIVLEGIDACGKASLAESLAAALGGTVKSFPDYASETGRLILKLLRNEVSCGSLHETQLALQALMTVNRYENVKKISHIRQPILILDRYWPSGVAYGTANGLDREWLLKIHGSLPPADFYFLLDIDPAVASVRRPEKRDAYETNLPMLGRARAEYLRLWDDAKGGRWRGDWHILNASKPADEVLRNALKIIGG